MKTLIEFLKRWTSGHQCKSCDRAISFLDDITKRKEDSIHEFRLTIRCSKDQAPELHITHLTSR